MLTGYWLLQIICGEPVLRGPYATDAEREHEYDMCLIDPGTEYIILIDPPRDGEAGPHAWKPSEDYKRERLNYINSIEDEAPL